MVRHGSDEVHGPIDSAGTLTARGPSDARSLMRRMPIGQAASSKRNLGSEFRRVSPYRREWLPQLSLGEEAPGSAPASFSLLP